MRDILIKNGRIWDGEKFFHGDVLCQDGVVVRIGEDINEKAYTFDASGMIVSPGLVDAHIHLKGPEPDKFGINVEMCCLPFGVTAAADAGGAHANRELCENYAVKTVTFIKADIRDNVADFTYTEERMQRYGEYAFGIKVYFDRNAINAWSVEPLAQICDYAHRRNMPVMVHCSHSPTPMADILRTLGKGDILTHAFHGKESTAMEDDFASMIEAKERGVYIDAGFAAHIHADMAIFQAAINKGVWPDTLSTDITRSSAYKRGGRYGLPMCMSMARTAGMTEEAIFRAVTSTPAKMLGKEDRWGRLYEGCCADIAVLQYTEEPYELVDLAGNRMADTMGYRCKLTVADGEVVWRD